MNKKPIFTGTFIFLLLISGLLVLRYRGSDSRDENSNNRSDRIEKDPGAATERLSGTSGSNEGERSPWNDHDRLSSREGAGVTEQFQKLQRRESAGFEAAKQNAGDIFALLNRIENVRERAAFIKGAFTYLASVNPNAALRLAREIEDAAEKQLALRTLVFEWRNGEWPNSREYSNIILSSGFTYGLGFMLLGGETPRPDIAVAWANEVLEGPRRIELLGRAAGRIAGDDPTKAFGYGNELAGQEWDRFVTLFSHGWAQEDPINAWNWSEDMEEDDFKRSIQRGILQTWTSRDPEQMSKHLGTVADESLRREAIQRIARQFVYKDTEAARNWADSLEDPDERRLAVERVEKTVPSGIGAMVARKEGYPTITELMPGGPAKAGGQLQINDRILAVDSGDGQFRDTWQMGSWEVARLILGEPGKAVRLEVLPEGARETADSVIIEITREQLNFQN